MLKKQRPFKRPSIIFIILAGLLLTACGAAQADNQNWPGLTAAGDRVYVAYGPAVVAYDAVTEEEAWVFSTDNRSLLFYAPPSVADGRVVIGDYGAAGGMFSPGIIVSAYGLEENGGRTPDSLWVNSETATDKIVAGPLQVGDTVFVGTADNHLSALDADTGVERWRLTTEGAVWAQPAYHEGVLYVTSLDKHVYALEAETGAEIWQAQLPGAISAQAVLNPEENLVYVGAYDNALHALAMDSGEEQWQVETTNWIWSAPALADGRLYFADSNAQVYAVEAASGDPIWTASVNEMRQVEGDLLPVPAPVEGAVQASAVVAAGKVFIASEGNRDTGEGLLIALDAETGEEIWQRTTTASLFTTPVIVDDMIVVAMNSEQVLLSAFDLETGDPQWAYVPASE